MTEKAAKGPLGCILSASQIITEEDIAKAIEEQKRSGCRFGEALLQLGIATQEDIDWALSTQLDIPYIRLKRELIDAEALALIPPLMARTHKLIPLLRTGNELTIAIADPLNRKAIEEVELHTGLKVNTSVAHLQEIAAMIALCYGDAGRNDLGFASRNFSDKALTIINSDVSGQKLLEYLLTFLIKNHLSSISLQPFDDIVSVIARHNGATTPIATLKKTYYPQINTILRKLAGMACPDNKAASGVLPFSYRNTPVSFLIATMPGYHGDYATLRPYIDSRIPHNITGLSLPREQETAFQTLASTQHGVTFFASRNKHERSRFMDLMLGESDLNSKKVLILGLEPGRMHKRFANIKLPEQDMERSQLIMDALDHEPDILVIEDATEPLSFAAACRAAMLGKRVLAGMQIRGTRNLLDHLLTYRQKQLFLPSCVNGVVSFKGIQTLCPDCRIEHKPSAEELTAMRLMYAPSKFYKASGCDKCGQSGFSARRFLMDNIVFDRNFLDVFAQCNDAEQIEQHLQRSGYRGAELEAFELLHEGKVSPDEYIASVIL